MSNQDSPLGQSGREDPNSATNQLSNKLGNTDSQDDVRIALERLQRNGVMTYDGTKMELERALAVVNAHTQRLVTERDKQWREAIDVSIDKTMAHFGFTNQPNRRGE